MFRNLSTSAKFLILCAIFVVTLGVTAWSLVAEKEIAIDFARKELLGNRYVAALGPIYANILWTRDRMGSPALHPAAADRLLGGLAAAEAEMGSVMQTGELAGAFEAALRELAERTGQGGQTGPLALDALAKGRRLIARIGDDSNLSLDPEIATYHLQDIVVAKLPDWFEQLADLRVLSNASTPISELERKVRLSVLEGVLMSSAEEIEADLAAAYRGNPDGDLKAAVDGAFATMFSNTRAYLAGLTPGASEDLAYDRAVTSAIAAWATAQRELDRLLGNRIDDLRARRLASLVTIGALTALSLLIAFVTYRHIVQPLKRLESVARRVRETKDYGLRMQHDSQDEIGRLANGFNEMLSELSRAREREAREQAELARVAQLTAMGAMTASIAHEVNQPLAAIVSNSNAAMRWLGNKEPDLDEARAALKRIVKDGHRASEVVGSVRAMFKKDRSQRTRVDIGGLVREALHLAQPQLLAHRVTVASEYRAGLPEVLADRVQLQQVFLNLVNNGAEAMAAVEDRERLIEVATALSDDGGVIVTVADTGVGIAPEDREKIFEPLFTTKASGMGMGLAICRSIVESHGGRLWISPNEPSGSVFHVALPAAADEGS